MTTPPALASTTAVAQLREAFAALTNQPIGSADLSLLQPLIYGVVDAMRDEGMFPERIVIVVRRLARETGIDWENDRVSEHIIRWCLRRYFDPVAPLD